MKAKAIPKDQINSLLKILNKDYRLFIPIVGNSTTKFEEFKENEEFKLPGYMVSRIPPKEILFPKTEVLFSYKNLPDGGVELKESPVLKENQIIFGLRSCDARSFKILDVFFASGQFRDTIYFNRRDKTAVIGLACNHPVSTCFCTSVGGAPFSIDGLDAQLIELEDKYIIKSVTESGEKILALLTDFEDANKKELGSINDIAEKSKKEMIPIKGIEGIEKKLDDLFGCDIWDYDGSTCLGCGTCAFTCPTCTCFDVQEQSDQKGGRRIRIWDSCQFPLFTLEGSGHNPRTVKKQRVRQRVYHKFNYYFKNYNLVGCVGCGRCIRACPAGSSVKQTIEEVLERA